jgi:murein DD-endopeptidase MepM/ murein hydrolase activator NlpD
MNIWKKTKRELKRQLTLMLIPHNSVKPIRFTFPVSLLLLLIASWTGFTLWAGYVASRHIDYWKIQTDHKLMQLKVIFFAQEIKKSQEMLEQVRENDENLRVLLQMKSKKAIIETEGRGGPTTEETADLNRLLDGKIYEMSQQDIHRQATAIYEEAKKQIESYQEITQYIDNERTIFRTTPNIWPCIGRVTSTFGFRIHPLYSSNEFHSGIDIANNRNTPIYATADGSVRLCDWQAGYGRLVIIDHGNNYKTYYGHLHKILVKTGDRISRGQLIGLMGSTGTSTGNHVHYEVQCGGHSINPVKFLKKVYSRNVQS